MHLEEELKKSLEDAGYKIESVVINAIVVYAGDISDDEKAEAEQIKDNFLKNHKEKNNTNEVN